MYQVAICQRLLSKYVWNSSFSSVFSHSATLFYNKFQCRSSIYEWALERNLPALEIEKFCVYVHFQGSSQDILNVFSTQGRLNIPYFSWNPSSLPVFSSLSLPSLHFPSFLFFSLPFPSWSSWCQAVFGSTWWGQPLKSSTGYKQSLNDPCPDCIDWKVFPTA